MMSRGAEENHPLLNPQKKRWRPKFAGLSFVPRTWSDFSIGSCSWVMVGPVLITASYMAAGCALVWCGDGDVLFSIADGEGRPAGHQQALHKLSKCPPSTITRRGMPWCVRLAGQNLHKE